MLLLTFHVTIHAEKYVLHQATHKPTGLGLYNGVSVIANRNRFTRSPVLSAHIQPRIFCDCAVRHTTSQPTQSIITEQRADEQNVQSPFCENRVINFAECVNRALCVAVEAETDVVVRVNNQHQVAGLQPSCSGPRRRLAALLGWEGRHRVHNLG